MDISILISKSWDFKRYSALFILLLVVTFGNGQTLETTFNQQLADSLGADVYGMKKYILVVLKTGESKMDNKHTTDSLFAGHLKNIVHLAKVGKLVVSGPIIQKNDKNYRGIFILNVATMEEAHLLLESDPAIREKLLTAEFYQWYGSAALPLYLKYHDTISKKKF